jgi:quinol monooxygenase YgiN
MERNQVLIVFSMQIVAPDEKRTAILRTLGSLLGPTRAAAGCMQAQLYADLDKRQKLLFVEEWESREQFERNLDTAKLNTIVAAIELSSEAPVVHVDSVEREEGVDTLALHRTPTGIARH